MRLLKLVLIAALLSALATQAEARRRPKVGFLLDFVSGVSIPIADHDYKNFADASFKMGVRLGAQFRLLPHLAIAPEIEFDFVPVNSSDATFARSHIDARFYRERGLFGARLIVPFDLGAFYFRAALGVDHIGGDTSIGIAGANVSTDWSSTGFTFEPGAGVEFHPVKHLVVGITTGFPIALHDFGKYRPHFTAVDVDFLAVVGLRL